LRHTAGWRLSWQGLDWLVMVTLLALVCSCASPASSRPGSDTAPVPSREVGGAPRLADPAPYPSPGSVAGTVPRVQFRRLTIEDGLSQSTVSCIVQDSLGFMWFGTQDGLNRYDGYEFQIYEHDADDPHSLSSNWVQHCYRDQRGSLWFITGDAVVHRYDAAMDRFHLARLEVDDPHRRGPENIRALLGDSAGRLWIGTYGGGLVEYDPEADRITYYRDDLDDPARESQHDNKVYTIFEDSSGTLWFGTGEGLVRHDSQSGSFVRYPYHAQAGDPPDPGALRSPYATSIYEDRAGRLWIGTTYGGLHELDRETGRFTAYPFSAADPGTFSGNSVRSLLEDREGNLWVASAEVKPDGTFERLGLERLDPETGEIVRFSHNPEDPCSLSHDAVLLMQEDRLGTLWFHTFAGGIDLYDRQTGCFAHYAHNPDNPRTLSDDSITRFYEDESGGMWLGTGTGGISFYHPSWTRFPSIVIGAAAAERESNNSVVRIYAPAADVDANGQAQVLWISTGAGLNRWDRRTGTFTFYQIDPELPDLVAYALYEDAAGTLWVGSDMGLYKGLAAAGGEMDFSLVLPRVTSQVGVVTAILPDQTDGDVWLGLYRIGLARFDVETGELAHTYEPDPADPNSLEDDAIGGMFPGRDGAMWIATGSVLDRFDPSTEAFLHYRHDPGDPYSLSAAPVLWVYEDESGAVWTGTNGDGLQRLDPATGTWTHYREKDGLPNDVVYAILPERGAGQTHLWLSTNRGLSRFDAQASAFRNYTYLDGLQSNEFNWQAAYLAPDGEMFFGGVDGINAFYPDQIWDDPYAPPVYITGLLLANQPAGSGSNAAVQRSAKGVEAARLSHRDRVVSFEFAALYYAMPERVQYAYMLEGFDRSWTPAGNRRFATYTSLPPRAYVFRVKAANADGVWNEAGALLPITVVPPVWATWWFRTLTAVLVVGAVAAGYRVRVRSVEERAQALERQVASRTRELAALSAVAGVVSASLDLQQILDGALDETLDVMGREAGGIYLLKPGHPADTSQEQTLKLVAHRGIDASLLSLINDLSVGEGFSGRVVQTAEPLLVDDLSVDERLTRKAVGAQGYRSLAVAPLVARGKVLGSLFVMTAGRPAQGQKDLELLTSIAGQVAVAFENARLYAAEQRRAEQFRVIGEVGRHVTSLLDLDGVLDEVASLVQRSFGFDHVGIALIEDGYAVYKVGAGELWNEPGFAFRPGRLKVGEEGITGWVAAEGKPLLVPDVSREPRYVWMEGSHSRSELALPITVKDRVIGVLDVQSNRINAFDQSDMLVLQSLADQAAIAIENARLFDAEQRRAEQFRALIVDNARLYEQAEQLAVMEERQRLARELHDAVTQTLFSASLIAEAVPTLWESDPEEGRALLAELRQLSRGALAEMRTLLLELRPAALVEANLRDLLRQLGEAVAGRTGVPVTVTVDNLCPLPEEAHVALYRIAQEALNNVAKHAHASQVEVRLHCTAAGHGESDRAKVELVITDDGRGFEVADAPPDHLGLGIIRERAQAIGAGLEIRSKPGGGTRVTVLWKES
jgi:signal transduction histidine kinase/ligand-binding sensor domain-containing protein